MALTTAFIVLLLVAVATRAQGADSKTPVPVVNTTGALNLTPSPAPQLEFNCTKGKVENIGGLDIDLKAVVVEIGSGKMCHILEKNCSWTSKFETMHVIYDKIDTKANIVAGKPHYYELKCKSGGYIARATATPLSIGLATPSYIPKEFTPSNRPGITIQLNKEGSEVTDALEIGQRLSLKIIGPANTTISPINCTATVTAENDDYLLWNNCTSKDTAIIENVWKITNTYTYSIDMYAFRFVDSEKVTIECSAFICPSSAPKCINTIKKCPQSSKRRRKRSTHLESTHLSEYEEETASVSFTVVGHFDGTNGSKEVFGNILLYLTSIVITIVFFGRE